MAIVQLLASHTYLSLSKTIGDSYKVQNDDYLVS